MNQYGGDFADIRVLYSYDLPIPFLSGMNFSSEAGTRVLLRDMP